MENHGESIKTLGTVVLVIGIICGVIIFFAGVISASFSMIGLSVGLVVSLIIMSILITSFGELLVAVSEIYDVLCNDHKTKLERICDKNIKSNTIVSENEYQRRIRLIDSIVNRNKGKYSEEEINKLKEFSKNASSTDFSNIIKEFI